MARPKKWCVTPTLEALIVCRRREGLTGNASCNDVDCSAIQLRGVVEGTTWRGQREAQ